ncbi:hypothetical protein L9F63_018164, partial [Diploptera punctata]
MTIFIFIIYTTHVELTYYDVTHVCTLKPIALLCEFSSIHISEIAYFIISMYHHVTRIFSYMYLIYLSWLIIFLFVV